jgi:hypothetical protein
MPALSEKVVSHKSQILALVYLLSVTAIIFGLFYNWAYDDPYITYRYAANLIQGEGFVYNPAERILSITSPLFAGILAAGGLLWSDLPRLANLLGAFFLALGALILLDLGKSWETPLVGWSALWLYPSFPLLLSTLGSEMPLYLALCMASFALYARRRYTWGAAAAGLAVLTRPDALLVPILLATDFVIKKYRPVPWRAVAVFLALTLPVLLITWLYFGSPLPTTLAAKQHQGSMLISQSFAQGMLTTIQAYSRQWVYWLEAGFAVLGAYLMIRRARSWLLFVSWGVLYFIAYTFLGVSRYFWYYSPLVPGFIALTGLGVTLLVSMASQRKSSAWKSSWNTLLAMILVLPLFLGQARGAIRLQQQPSRLELYRAIGKWLQANTAPGARVGTLEVGIIGYYSQHPMIDFAGLIQPEVARQLRENTTYDDAALWATQKYQPEYLVVHEGLFPKLEADYITQHCQLITTFDGNEYNYPSNLKVYSCK